MACVCACVRACAPKRTDLECTQGKYAKANLALYVSVGFSRVMPEAQLLRWLDGAAQGGEEGVNWKKEAWEELPLTSTLTNLLSMRNHVLPGVPCIYVVPRGSDFQERFLDGDW